MAVGSGNLGSGASRLGDRGEPPPWGAFPPVAPMEEGAGEPPQCCFMRALTPSLRLPILTLVLPRGPASYPITVGMRFQHVKFLGTQTFSPYQ